MTSFQQTKGKGKGKKKKRGKKKSAVPLNVRLTNTRTNIETVTYNNTYNITQTLPPTQLLHMCQSVLELILSTYLFNIYFLSPPICVPRALFFFLLPFIPHLIFLLLQFLFSLDFFCSFKVLKIGTKIECTFPVRKGYK